MVGGQHFEKTGRGKCLPPSTFLNETEMVGRSKLGKMVRGSSKMVGGKLTKMVGGVYWQVWVYERGSGSKFGRMVWGSSKVVGVNIFGKW